MPNVCEICGEEFEASKYVKHRTKYCPKCRRENNLDHHGKGWKVISKQKRASTPPKMDCFAYHEGKCSALTAMECSFGDGNCNFYKPKHMVPMVGSAKTCEFCGNLYIPSKYTERQSQYCSRECAGAARSAKRALKGLETVIRRERALDGGQ